MENDDRLKQLHDYAALKDESEQRLYRRIDYSLRIARTVYALVAAIVLAAVWLYAIQVHTDYNTRAIEKLWLQSFHVPLP